MKRKILILLFVACCGYMFAQPAGYYEGTTGLDSAALRTALHDIIKDHKEIAYYNSKNVFKKSDEDPANSDNIILVYTGRSVAKDTDYGSAGNELNREHVWAKSHGQFDEQPPAYSDIHNLKPVDASVNASKSNLDFDWGGDPHSEATGCKSDADSWEPRDEVKGDVARIVFYMSIRYEGENGEPDLEVVDEVGTYPMPQHGKLSALLEWHKMDPPDQFEKNRNDVIYSWQKNRNPFVDHPEYAEILWDGADPGAVDIASFTQTPDFVSSSDAVTVSADITTTNSSIDEVTLLWGTDWDNLSNTVTMTNSGGDTYEGEIPDNAEETEVAYKIMAIDNAGDTSYAVASYLVRKVFSGTITTIKEIQGEKSASDYDGQTKSTTGVVTASIGSGYYIQDGYGAWNGLYIYDDVNVPDVGDSIVVTGEVTEYYTLTELTPTDYYYVSSGHDLPEPVVLNTGDIKFDNAPNAEQYESVRIKVEGATCTFDDYKADFYMWKVNDGSGEAKIHNTFVYNYDPTQGVSYDVTGILTYTYSEWKVDIISEADVVEAEDLTAPSIKEVNVTGGSYVEVIFDEDITQASAETAANYTFTDGINVVLAMHDMFQKDKVILQVTNMTQGMHTLTANNIEDLNSNTAGTLNFIFTSSYDGPANIANVNQYKVNIFPIPANESLNIQSFRNIQMVELYNLAGQPVLKINGQGSQTMEINTSQLNPGVYNIRVLMDENETVNKKLVIQ
jgi:endonuclease I